MENIYKGTINLSQQIQDSLFPIWHFTIEQSVVVIRVSQLSALRLIRTCVELKSPSHLIDTNSGGRCKT